MQSETNRRMSAAPAAAMENGRAPVRVLDGGPRARAAAPAGLPEIVRTLAELLGEMRPILERLSDLAGQKLAAMRRADAAALNAGAAEEAGLVQQLALNARKRQVALARLAQQMQAPELVQASVSEISAAVGEPLGSILTAKSLPLQHVAAELERKNNLASAVARNLQTHIRAVFQELDAANQETVVYGNRGKPTPHRTRNWVDAVG